MRYSAALVLSSAALGFAGAVAACGGQIAPSEASTEREPPPAASSPSPTPSSPRPAPSSSAVTQSKDASAYCPPPSDPSWTLAPSAYDTTCAQDEDCRPAFFGTTVCSDPTVALCTCPNAAIAKTSGAEYEIAADALGKQCGACRPPNSAIGCLCPAFGPRCTPAGTCTICLLGDTTCGR